MTPFNIAMTVIASCSIIGLLCIFIVSNGKKIKSRRQDAAEAKKLIESIARTYNVAYVVNMSNDSYRQLRMDEFILGNGESFSNFTQAKEFFFDLLPESDKVTMKRELDYHNIRRRLSTTNSYSVEYRAIINGATIWHEMRVSFVDEDKVAIGFAVKDLEITKRHLEEKRFSEYFALYEVDLDTEKVKIVIDSPFYNVSRNGNNQPYSASMLAFAASLEGDARELFTKMADVNYVKKVYAKDDKYTYTYKSKNVGEKVWVDLTSFVTLRHEDGTPAMISLGFSWIDSFGAARQELQSRIAQQKDMLEEKQEELQKALESIAEEKNHVDAIRDLINSAYWSCTVGDNNEISNAKFYGDAEHVLKIDIEITPESWSEILHPDDRERATKAFYAAVSDHSGKTPFDIEYQMRGSDGNYNWFRSAAKIITRNDGTREFFGILFNINDKVLEDEKKNEQLQQTLIDAQAASRAKSEFLFNMSHDIRTPLTAILGYSNIAENHLDDRERLIDCIEKTQQSGKLLLTLISSVLDMSRIESGNAESEERVGDVYYSFTEIESTLREAAAAKDVSLSFEFRRITDRYVYADFTRCLRIFTNLISNAIKYSKEGGHVRVICEQAAPKSYGMVSYVYTIEDDGIGMSEEFQEHMFEPFAREHNSTMSGIQGTGLGLSVCKSFVDYLNGTIECESKPGVGTKFTVVLPFKIQDGQNYTDPVTGEVRTGEEDVPVHTVELKGKRILLAEDNEMNREIVLDILNNRGLVTETAENGLEAVEKIRENAPDYYDLILMDIQMPVKNGYEATSEIRDIYPDAHIPIIAISANAFEEDRRASIEAGMDAHIAKPINVTELYNTISKVLAR